VEGDVTLLEAGTGNSPNPSEVKIMFYYLDVCIRHRVLLKFGLIIGANHFRNIPYDLCIGKEFSIIV
jgi:hypothetical protein